MSVINQMDKMNWQPVRIGTVGFTFCCEFECGEIQLVAQFCDYRNTSPSDKFFEVFPDFNINKYLEKYFIIPNQRVKGAITPFISEDKGRGHISILHVFNRISQYTGELLTKNLIFIIKN